MKKTDNKEIKPGFKPSPLGPIPSDWEVKEVGEVCDKFLNGGTPSTKIEEYWNGTIPWITGADIIDQRISHVRRFISEKAVKESSTNIIQKGNLLLVTRTGVGKLSIAPFDVAISQDLTGLLLNGVLVNAKFAFCFFDGCETRLKQLNQGTSINGITRDVLRTVIIPIPPLPEQCAIVACLSSWDNAILKVQALLAQKELRKKWLMQNLLTGKKRLKGFEGEWKTLNMENVFDRVARKNLENNTNIVTISAQRGFVSQTDFFNKSIASEITDNYFLVEKGEFCYNKSYSNGYPWGATKRLNDFEKAVVTTLYICFSNKDKKTNCGDFFEQFFEANLLDKGLTKIAHEGGRAHGLLNVTPSDFFSLKITVPNFQEQTAIANVLQIADKEIQLLKTKVEKLKEQKKGLMKVLLTGKRRLKTSLYENYNKCSMPMR